MRNSARWRSLLSGSVSLKRVLQAFVPILAWIAFIALFDAAYRVAVHLSGAAGAAVGIVRLLVEIVTLVLAMKYFFLILHHGAAEELSVPHQERS